MTKREALNYANLNLRLVNLGIDNYADVNALLRIEKTLRRWSKLECNGEVEVDEATGKAHVVFLSVFDKVRRYPTANRERGALKRLATIMAKYPKLAAYQQGDPRGCALYVYEKSKLDALNTPAHAGRFDIGCCYSTIGVAVCL